MWWSISVKRYGYDCSPSLIDLFFLTDCMLMPIDDLSVRKNPDDAADILTFYDLRGTAPLWSAPTLSYLFSQQLQLGIFFWLNINMQTKPKQWRLHSSIAIMSMLGFLLSAISGFGHDSVDLRICPHSNFVSPMSVFFFFLLHSAGKCG